jgi:hypothetical protein
VVAQRIRTPLMRMAGGLARLARSSREVVVAGDQCGWLPDRVGVDAEVAVGGRAGGGQRGRWVQAVAGEQGDLAGQGAGGVGAGEDRYARGVGQRQQLGQALAQLGDPLPDRSDAFWLRWTTADRVGLHAVPDRAMSRSAASMPVPCSMESTPAYQSRDLAGTPYSYPCRRRSTSCSAATTATRWISCSTGLSRPSHRAAGTCESRCLTRFARPTSDGD